MPEWAATRLGSCLRVKHGYAFEGEHFSDCRKYPTLVTPRNFALGGGFKRSKAKTFSGDVPPGYALSPGDLVISMTDLSKNGDTLGLPGVIPTDGAYLHNQRIGLVQLTEDSLVTTAFLAYFLRTSQYRRHILDTATGTTVKHTSPTKIEAYVAQLPPRRVQIAIAEVLGSLDDKIAVNDRVAHSATQLAKSLADRLIQHAEVHWRRLDDIASTALGGTPSRSKPEYWTDGTVPWLNSGEANKDRVLSPTALITEAALRESATKMMPRGSTVLAITGATLGQIARLEIPACGNQSLVGIWSNQPELNDWLYFAVQMQLPHLLGGATGAAQQHVNRQDVDSLLVPLPIDVKLTEWAVAARPLLDLAASADRESLALVSMRDALLPRLMSGQLRVRDAERTVGDRV